MTGCSLHDQDANVYTFSGFALPAGGEVQLFSGCGTDTAAELYWCVGAIWKNAGELATFRDVDGSIVDTFYFAG